MPASARGSRDSAHILEGWWRRLEPRSGDKRCVLADDRWNRWKTRWVGRWSRLRSADDLATPRERSMDVRRVVPKQLHNLDQELRGFVGDLVAGRSERREAMASYVYGLLLDGERKSMEPMAARKGVTRGEGAPRDARGARHLGPRASPRRPHPLRRRVGPP